MKPYGKLECIGTDKSTQLDFVYFAVVVMLRTIPKKVTKDLSEINRSPFMYRKRNAKFREYR